MSKLIGIKPDAITLSEILDRHEAAGIIIAALVKIDKHLKEQLEYSKDFKNNRELHLANVAVLSTKRTEARRNFVVYVRGTIDMMATV